ncbi:AbrB/MazE/SpoVT family DNA-binding domain-containing protein [Sphingomonas sp. CFBP 8760]|uniref:AbrB/MazE/SpoVT family DNA-binding domain-containing protein n=1 Tax=Sphingomonas sp. CFBP 8760 TaxID=2775282 RepID=UPI00177CD9A8|nr:AbrB/MazE/SpoVT family DNA-binding domain-containing protein [Sphingomonas sp. CFBP 8760]MBD8548514.1 AbrB/MazE/SpoVT family DNA-binding domain-containing protein [Sphingomonas sp. CFBP 8760]
MGAIETRTFRSGNSVAVRLPKSFGLSAGTMVTMEQVGDTVMVKPAIDADAEKAKVSELVRRLRAIGPITPIEERAPIEFPDRTGLE